MIALIAIFPLPLQTGQNMEKIVKRSRVYKNKIHKLRIKLDEWASKRKQYPEANELGKDSKGRQRQRTKKA
jgi:hypothetical protein